MRFPVLIALAAGLVLPVLASAPAHAQATRTWVSGVGDDANPCSRTAPCKTFAGAISKTAAAGEINCLDQGAYGAVTITKSMTISCIGVTAGVLATLSSSGVIINAGANDNIFLKGLDIEGAGSGGNGIRFLAGKSLIVEDTRINGFGATSGLGISFVPTTSTFLSLINTTITNNGSVSGGGGVQLAPTGSGFGVVVMNNVRIERNFVGIGGSGANTANAVIKDSSISNNSGNGISVSGGVSVRIGSSLISGNGSTAVVGNVSSFNNNQINNNNPDSVPSTILLH